MSLTSERRARKRAKEMDTDEQDREREFHIKLFCIGAIDRQALLENLDYPAWEAI